MAESRPGPAGENGRPDPTTPLLALVSAQALDEDYAHVARRRTLSGTSVETPDDAAALRRSRARRLTPVAVAAFGLLVAVAATQAERNAGVEELGRATLLARIGDGKEQVATLQERLARLRRSTVDEDAALNRLVAQQDDLDGLVRRLGVRTGYVAASGEGVRITVDDNPDGDLTTQVRDEDLATLVDGLWTAGATAIAINDQRLTALSGIRNTDRAIHVNGRPLVAPYTVLALGDTDTLQASLLASSQGEAWFTLVRTLGFRFSIDNDDELRLPAARAEPLRHVEAGTSDDDEGRPRDAEEGGS